LAEWARTPPAQISTSSTYDEFRARRADPSVAVIDVLPPATYKHSHIPGAKSLPLVHLQELAPDVLLDKQQELILYCASFT
jgi:rhodanese-related sulfurtransferase